LTNWSTEKQGEPIGHWLMRTCAYSHRRR